MKRLISILTLIMVLVSFFAVPVLSFADDGYGGFAYSVSETLNENRHYAIVYELMKAGGVRYNHLAPIMPFVYGVYNLLPSSSQAIIINNIDKSIVDVEPVFMSYLYDAIYEYLSNDEYVILGGNLINSMINGNGNYITLPGSQLEYPIFADIDSTLSGFAGSNGLIISNPQNISIEERVKFAEFTASDGKYVEFYFGWKKGGLSNRDKVTAEIYGLVDGEEKRAGYKSMYSYFRNPETGETINNHPVGFSFTKSSLGEITSLVVTYPSIDSNLIDIIDMHSGPFNTSMNCPYGSYLDEFIDYMYSVISFPVENKPVEFDPIIYDDNITVHIPAHYTEAMLLSGGSGGQENMQEVTIPPGYAIAFYNKGSGYSSQFNFMSLVGISELGGGDTGHPKELKDPYDHGIRYDVYGDWPSIGEVDIRKANPILMKNVFDEHGKIKYTQSQFSFGEAPGDCIVVYNPVSHAFMKSYPNPVQVKNKELRIKYNGIAYAARMYSIVTSDDNGFIPVGIAESEYQPYNPYPNDPNDKIVEVVNVNNPDYVDTSDPGYVPPDPDSPGAPLPDLTGSKPPAGGHIGGQAPPPEGHEYYQGERNVFDRIMETVNTFKSLLTNLFVAPIGAIEALISSGSAFFSVVKNMFGWLPTEVMAMVSAGLMLFVVIGVIKMLL